MNEIIEKTENMSEKQLVNNIVKSCDKIKENSYNLCIMICRLYKSNPSTETTDLLIEKTALKKSTITQMKKAGEFFIENPSLSSLDYSKAYLLSKLDEGTLVTIDNDELLSMSQREVKDLVKSHTENISYEREDNDVEAVKLYHLSDLLNSLLYDVNERNTGDVSMSLEDFIIIVNDILEHMTIREE